MSVRPVRPRLHLHRGTVVAVAFWFDPSLLGEREARRRVLTTWTPGTSVFALAGGFLLRLPRARPMDCATAPGLPLTLAQGVLLSAPLSATEREHLAPPPGSTVLVRAGRAEVFPDDPSRRIELAAWLDVSGWSTIPVKGLGAPPPPVKVLEPIAVPARSLFQGVPAPDPEAEAMRARMEGRQVPQSLQSAQSAREGFLSSLWARMRAWLRGERAVSAVRTAKVSGTTQGVPAASGPSALRRFVSWLKRSLGPGGGATVAQRELPLGRDALARTRAAQSAVPPSWLRRTLWRLREALSQSPSASSASTSSLGRSKSSEPTAPSPPQGPSLLSRFSEWLLRNTPLGPLLGQRKAEYVQRLFEMFEQGDIDEALRYAIPLGDEKMTEQARIALGLPGPRDSLAIRPHRGGSASIFGGGQAVYQALKERYRAAFRRLEREGRIDEAAFVLTELLAAHEEAGSFLEKHGRLKLAAELAEGRGLAPGLVVRQWLLAKDIRRAVAIARRSGAFPDAVLRLERTHPAQARTMRLLWAETLAEAGDYMRAAVVVWPLEDARPLARAWLEQGATVGGVGGARALARLVSAFPDGFEAARPQALELLEDESQARAAERLAFAEILASEPRSESRTALVGPSVRALLRDRAAHHTRVDASFLTRLLRDGGDGTLRADLPAISDPRRRPWADETGAPLLREELTEAEAGPYPIYDAVALSSQRVLLALGEAGVRLVRGDGTCVAHFDVPAFWLAPSVHEDRVLALAPRGELKRISRIELGPRRAAHWCDAKVDAFAPSHDGNLWFVSEADTVMAVDALASDGLRALWRVSQVEGRVMALEADAEALRFATWGTEPQLWIYSLPGGPTLRARAKRREGDGFPLWALNETTGKVERMESPVHAPPWMLTYRRAGDHDEVGLVSKGDLSRALFIFKGEVRVQHRFSSGDLLLFDTAGRLLRVDLVEGTARRVPVQ